MKKRFEGLCFVNLVDFDMLYGHRNDVDGYAKALSYFDKQLPKLLGLMREGDILMITQTTDVIRRLLLRIIPENIRRFLCINTGRQKVSI